MNQPIGDRVSDLRFNLRVSIRYCQKLRRFWSFVSIVTDTATFLGSSAAVATLIVPQTPNVSLAAGLAAAAVVASAIALILKPERRASEWLRYAKEHNTVLGDLDELDSDEPPSEFELTQLQRRKSQIDVEEGSSLRVLAAICYNEEVVSRDLGDQYRIRVGPVQRLLSRMVDVGDHKLAPMGKASRP